MEGCVTASQIQMNFLDQKEPLWCERTQVMSGYELPDITSPLSDEQTQFEISAAQYGHDIEVQNSENPSPEEFIFGESFDALGEDSNMFDNSNYSLLDTKIRAWLPKISNTEINEFANTSLINGDFNIRINTDNPPLFQKTPKVEKKPIAYVNKKSVFSIFDCEEPLIKEESESSYCTDNKLTFELRDDMEVAEEVVVTTEYIDELESKQKPFSFSSTSLKYLVESKKEDINTQITEELSSPVRDSSIMENPYDMKFDVDDDFLYTLDPVTCSPVPEPKVAPKLHLDIASAIATSNQLVLGDLVDTPDVLKPVLNPGSGFDIIDYLLNNNCDSNNNTSATSPRSCTEILPQQRRGKSQLSLAELKKSQNRSCDVQTEPTSGPSTVTSSSQRPTRKSASKFKKRIQDGFLNTETLQYDSSDECESLPKAKRRRTTSSSCNRKRLNSDSDQSSVCESAVKYRERRDRNNISSRKSRQKRKIQQELKKEEMKKLEDENKRLKRHSEKLQATLQRVHAAWKEYLKKMNNRK